MPKIDYKMMRYIKDPLDPTSRRGNYVVNKIGRAFVKHLRKEKEFMMSNNKAWSEKIESCMVVHL